MQGSRGLIVVEPCEWRSFLSVDYIPHFAKRVYLTQTRSTTEYSMCVFSRVSDLGHGIIPSHHSFLFDETDDLQVSAF